MNLKQLLKSATLTLMLIAPTLAEDSGTLQHLNKLKSDILHLKKFLEGDEKHQESLNDKLKNTELNLADLSVKIKILEGKLKNLNLELKALRVEDAALKISLQSQKKLIVSYITSLHRQGGQEPIRLLLSQKNPQSISRTLEYYNYFLRARGEKINTYKSTIQELASIEKSIVNRQAKLLENRSKLKKITKNLLTAQQHRKKIVKSLNKKIYSSQTKLSTLNNERSRLESIFMDAERSTQNLPASSIEKTFAASKGKLPWPTNGQLSNRYDPLMGSELHSKGWLLSAIEGALVSVIHDGEIIFSGYLKNHGLLVIVNHNNGYMTLYAHNQVLLKKTGDWVLKGENISRVGNTGGQEKHALYFEVRQNGKPSNPKIWLKKKSPRLSHVKEALN
ncbi:MAG: peptidoglycan DD-metalloendopeptidase family protein [Porticoccus sp.]|nr:peptidoglycan DD-metalloendopeptidase family protein [Porticoccus sp.]